MALLGAIGSLAGNIFGSSSTRSTNRTNMKIAQMNNQFAAVEAEKNRDFQAQQWQKQFDATNKYNTPSNQRALLEEAGYNPYALLGGTNAMSSGATAPAGSQASPSGNPVMQAYHPDFSGVSEAINSFYQNRKIASETSGIDTQNSLVSQFGSDINKAQIANLLGGNFAQLEDSYRDYFTSRAEPVAQLNLGKMRSEAIGAELTNQLNLAQSALLGVKAKSHEIINEYLGQSQQMQLLTSSAQAFMYYRNGLLSEQQLKNAISERFKVEAETQKVGEEVRRMKIDNRVAFQVAGDLVEALKMQYRYQAVDFGSAAKFASKSNYLDYLHQKLLYNSTLDEYDFTKHIKYTPGNRWIRKNIDPVAGILGNILGAGFGGAIGSSLLRSGARVSRRGR